MTLISNFKMDYLNESNTSFSHLKELKARKEALELKISEKYFELKNLCVTEAELTGIVPMEIPLEPDGSPPKIKRRVVTMFPYTDDVINQLQINQFPNLPATLGKSPKRKTPLTPWNPRCNTLPQRSPGKQSIKLKASPKNKHLGTWPGGINCPDEQQTNCGKTRQRFCRNKLNNLFRNW